MKKILAGSAAIVLGLGMFSAVFAADFIPVSHDEQNVTVSSTETHKNPYVAGANVTVDSNTVGDLAVAGGMIVLNGPIEQDVLAAGGTIISNANENSCVVRLTNFF